MASLKLVEPAAPEIDLDALNARLAEAPPEAVLEWAREEFGDRLILSSSFGAESAVMLHLANKVIPGIPVVFLDTGYLFPETYAFAEELTERLKLNLRVYNPKLTAARQEALYGKLWEGDEQALARYNEINKVEPMDRALRELGARAWVAGLRGNQNSFRSGLRPVELQAGIYKVHPILGWDREQIHHYLRSNDLPYHPLYRRGYRSIGDVHSTRPTQEGEDARSGRRLGVHSECGLHLPRLSSDDSLKSSGL
ncbi:MAG TPA: phosphoadenylyl-sulfate reductase [Polyangiaceae bacterium]|nr:phosphoadenylyl-sulfate reductase [Polyangiaceae bacterium]